MSGPAASAAGLNPTAAAEFGLSVVRHLVDRLMLTDVCTYERGLSLHVEVEATADTGIDETSYVQCELIRSISRNRLVHRLGAIDPDASNKVATIIKTLLNY